MDFKSSYRMEAVYFQKLKSDIDIVKSLMNDGNTEEARTLLENAVDVDGAVLLLYRNLGDIWGELGAQIQKTNEALKELKEATDKYHEELNEKIDDVNNTIIRLLNALEDRIAAVERDLATMSRVKILSLVNENGTYHIYDGETEIDFDALSEMVEFPHNVIIRGVVNGEETEFRLREFDTDETSGVFEFYSTGLANNVVSETTVTVLSDDSVNVATDIQTMKEYTAGNGINISSGDEISVDFGVVQEKLTAGSGISIDPDTNEITNTSPGKIYTAGSGINISEAGVISQNTVNFPDGDYGDLALIFGSWNGTNLGDSITRYVRNITSQILNYLRTNILVSLAFTKICSDKTINPATAPTATNFKIRAYRNLIITFSFTFNSHTKYVSLELNEFYLCEYSSVSNELKIHSINSQGNYNGISFKELSAVARQYKINSSGLSMSITEAIDTVLIDSDVNRNDAGSCFRDVTNNLSTVYFDYNRK